MKIQTANEVTKETLLQLVKLFNEVAAVLLTISKLTETVFHAVSNKKILSNKIYFNSQCLLFL